MDINQANFKQQSILNKPANYIGKTPTEASSADQEANPSSNASLNSGDTVKLSADALQMAKSSYAFQVAVPTPVTDKKQAQGLVAKLAADIRNYPNIALNASSNVSLVNIKSLLN